MLNSGKTNNLTVGALAAMNFVAIDLGHLGSTIETYSNEFSNIAKAFDLGNYSMVELKRKLDKMPKLHGCKHRSWAKNGKWKLDTYFGAEYFKSKKRKRWNAKTVPIGGRALRSGRLIKKGLKSCHLF